MELDPVNDRPPSDKRSLFAASWIRAVALWILAGALFKLFRGTPADLPRLVRDLPLELGLTYKLAIAAELGIAFTALLRPRWGWPLELALLAVFDAVLATQIAAGDASCGCFGTSITIPPWVMLAIDSTLLAGLLLARPWSAAIRGGAHPWIVAGALALAAALPWIFDREVKQGGLPLDGSRGARRDAYLVLDVEDWVGREIWDTPLGQPPLSASIDVNALPLDGLWVFYRSTCDHCAEHLKALAETDIGETAIALVRLEEATDTEANRVVHALPTGALVKLASLPPSLRYTIQTPAELLLEAGKIVAAREGVTSETGLLAEPR